MSEHDRVLPAEASLEQQKKQAKELLRALHDSSDDALPRFRAHLPDKDRLSLADAQFVIAREYGFASWADMKRHIETRTMQQTDMHADFHRAFEKRDVRALRALFERHPDARAMIDESLFAFVSPALAVATARRRCTSRARAALGRRALAPRGGRWRLAAGVGADNSATLAGQSDICGVGSG